MSRNLTLTGPRRVSYGEVVGSPKVRKLIDGANAVMLAMGYTEHGHRHVAEVARMTEAILRGVGAPEREVELGLIAAHLHDVGNIVSRFNHPLHGGAIAFTLLNEMGMDVAEMAPILGAIGNHEELSGVPVSRMSAALIIADKSDVHRSRVQNPVLESFDIHDRVNYAVQSNRIEMCPEDGTVCLNLTIDPAQATLMEYFEIFLHRMILCRRSASLLGLRFCLDINGVRLE